MSRITRETLKDFLIQKGSTQDSISITTSATPDGIGLEPGTEEELLNLLNDTSGLLGEYLKFLVDNSSNNFKIKTGNSLAPSANKGDSIPIADSMGAENIFVEQGTLLKAKLNENSNSKQFDDSGTPITDLIDKTGNNFSNHDKLKEITGRPLSTSGQTLTNPNGIENDIVQATQRIFLKNNRFANVGDENKTSFTSKPQDVKEFESSEKNNNKGTLNVQNKFGVYDQDNSIVSFDDLKKLGASLLYKASGFDQGDSPSSSGNIEDVSEGITSLDINNNIDKNTGFNSINFGNLRSKNAKGFPTGASGESLRAGRGDLIENDNNGLDTSDSVDSFGTTYNDAFRFTGKSIKLHKIQAAISLIALKSIAGNFFNSFMNQLRNADKIDLTSDTESYLRENSKVDVGLYMLGKSRKLASLKIDNYIINSILTNTTYPFGDAVDRGLEIVLGPDKDSNDEEKIIKNNLIAQSPGYWLAIANSVLKSYKTIAGKYGALNETLEVNDLFLVYRDLILKNNFIKFFNVMAVIGDISLQSTAGVKNAESDFKHPRDVDAIPDNRAVHKSRKKFGSNKNQLSWEQDAAPSMYLLPANIIRAASKLNNTFNGESPVRGMFGSKLVKNTYTGVDVDGSYNRIPNEVVKIVEDKLDAEYVPFYIQDLRTNEIISFNAFLETLTDSITPNYSSIDGYGRMDSIQIYKNTTRSLQVGFTLFATNREDFDSMWYKINKLVTLLYPQWTAGSMVSNAEAAGEGGKFYMPFSQVIGASPVVRLRIGDVIKSNYSRFALARTFGIGDSNVKASTADNSLGSKLIKGITGGDLPGDIRDIILKVWLGLFGSPHSIVNAAFNAAGQPDNQLGKIAMKAARGASIQLISNLLVNGFSNPLAVGGIIRQLRDPNLSSDVTALSGPVGKLQRQIDESSLINLATGDGIPGGYQTGFQSFRQMFLKPNVVNGYYCEESGKKYLIPRRLKVRVVQKGTGFEGLPPNTIGYRVKVVDSNAPSELGVGRNKHLIVAHHDILPDPKALFTNSIVGAALFATDPGGLIDSSLGLLTDVTQGLGIPNELNDMIRSLYASDTSLFMRPELNPFARAIESTKGRGLAGVMGGINFDWLDNSFGWETDFNARAPMGCKISFSFNVIHDIPPGLDHSGYNKAPLYNVGEIMRNVSGDVYSDDGKQAEFNFRKEGGYATRSTGKNNK